MNKTLKKVLIGIGFVAGIGIIGYISFVGFVMYTFASGCGMDDGPFNAVLIDQTKISKNSEMFELDNNGILILDNRN